MRILGYVGERKEYDLVFSIKVKWFFHVLYSDTKFNEETPGQWNGKKRVGEDNL